jgi:hypothetical protein
MADLPDFSSMTLGELRDESIVLREATRYGGTMPSEERNHLYKIYEAANEEMIRRVREKYKVKV